MTTSVRTGSGSMRSAFGFGFNHRIVHGGAAGGVFDDSGRHQIVIGTDSNKILLQSAEAVFHVPETITALSTFRLPSTPTLTTTNNNGFNINDNKSLDAVIIGTASSLTAFDIYNNKTLFHRDLPEGVNCIKVGSIDDFDEDTLICGCGTTIWGLKCIDGSDLFWTALGDEINALELCDMDGDGKNELIAGSNGTEIKVMKRASFLLEFDEGDPCVALCAISTNSFAFGLSSGVVGVYGNGERHWRVKTKSRIITLLSIPSSEQILCVWNNGKVDVRGWMTGEICSKEQLDHGEVAAAFLADINDTGTAQLTVVFCNGQVRGVYLGRENGAPNADDGQRLIREYGQRKHNLLEELKNYEQHTSTAAEGGEDVNNAAANNGQSSAGASTIPADTTLGCALDLTAGGLCIHFSINNDIPIRAVLLFAEGIFDSECYAIHPNADAPSSQLTAYFSPENDIAAELFIKVFGGYTIERQLHVFEVNQVLPRFATFLPIVFAAAPADATTSSSNNPTITALTNKIGALKEPTSFVEFGFGGIKIDGLNAWLSDNFLFTAGATPSAFWTEKGSFFGRFLCTRRNAEALMTLEIVPSGEKPMGTLRMDSIESCGNLIQSLFSYLGVKQLETRAYFPHVLEAVERATTNLDEKYSISDRLSSDWAGRLNMVRECVVRAEDALVIGTRTDARKMYIQMAKLNRELVVQQSIRVSTRDDLLGSLKTINLVIEQFSRLRVGQPASRLIVECRKALRDENLSLLPRLLQFGAI